jgi:Concanavalin A-like lectin/glucanases superfamily
MRQPVGRDLLKLFGALMVAALAACGGGTDETASLATDDYAASPKKLAAVRATAVAPQLGAHVLLAQNEYRGTSPAITPPVTTQSTGSTFIAVSMGWLSNYANPTDTYQNTWTHVSGPNEYYSPQFYTAVWATAAGQGGANHRLSFNKASYPTGESSTALIEVTNGGTIDTIYRLGPVADQSPGSITVDGPATLIAIWSGDGNGSRHSAVPDNGFTVIDSYLNFVPSSDTAVQVAIASKQVTAAGTYTVRWTTSPAQKCACYLIAVRNATPAPPDTTPPTGSFQINGGAANTSQPGVTLTLTATDDATGVARMRFSNDGVNFATPIPFATSAPWTLVGGDGVKTVHTQFQDGAGNWSAAVSANITLTSPPPDTAPPTGSLQINGGAASTSQPSVTLTLAATDDATGVARMRFSNDGVTFGAAIAFAASAPWTLSSGDGPKTVYAQFQDGAGNWSAAVQAGITLVTPPVDTTPPSGSVRINGGAGSTTTVDVTLTLAATDNATGVTRMRFSNNGTSFGTPVAFAATAAWRLTAGNGVKQVFAQFQDGAGNWSGSTSASITLTAPPGTGGLIAAYGFNEGQGTTTADATGNGLTGTLSSATWVPTGRFGSALNFTGQSASRVTVASSPLLQFATAFTISAWVNPRVTQSAEPTIVAKEISGRLSFVLYSKGSGIGPNTYAFVGGNYRTVASPSMIPANTWTYLTATYDGSILSIYVNGELIQSTLVGGNFVAGTGALRIGNNAVFSNEGFNGQIDEVRVYSRALSLSEIATDMQAPVTGP